MGDIDQLAINSIRFLSVDQVEKAKSGHPGMPLGASHIIYIIFDRFLKFNPKNPKWFNRDRFVLSAGHASAMLYATLYMFGYDIDLEDLKSFRQLGSITPGHPENFLTPGVEATTGPLGQGFANAVGMALAERYLANRFNRDRFNVVDHFTYVLCSDGDLMEGISYEAGAVAGHLCLNKLIVIWDNNHVSIDGDTSLAWSESVADRFKALGWDVQVIEDGYNLKSIEEAVKKAKNSEKPSFISVRTHIGYGSPLQDTAKVHGAPLGPEKAEETRKNLGWKWGPFEVPEEALNYTRRHIELGRKREEEWKNLLEEYRREFPELFEELKRAIDSQWRNTWYYKMERFEEPLATRKASGVVINAIAKEEPLFIGGSADLTESNNTLIKEGGHMSRENPLGRNIHFGVREHAMGGILNGMAYHGGILPFGGTFLIFSDYMRPTIRLAAMAGLQVIYVFTHDSIGLGEDGPTHQPIEQLPSLRLIPNLVVIRPADANEVRVAWKVAIERKDGPTALILSRQTLPLIDRKRYPSEENLSKGAYVLKDPEGNPDVILIASGSEVHVAIAASDILEERGIKVRIVNFPSIELFEMQDESYKEAVLPSEVKNRVAIEAARGICWDRYVGTEGLVVSMETFGKSAPGKDLFQYFGFTAESVAQKIIGKWYS